MPLVGSEVQRIREAFRQVSLELSGGLAVLRDLHVTTVGTPSCDDAVSSGTRDLAAALGGLQQAAEECVAAMSRYVGPDLQPAAAATGSPADKREVKP